MIDWEVFYNSLRKKDFLPGFEIQNRLGGGAFGEVYKARKQSIGKVYAVKFLKVVESTAEEAIEHELEQVRYFASFDHPNLVTIEDMGVVMGVPYVIMGYAGEDTLARRMQRGELESDNGMRFFVQACRGVLALHDRRLAHFDLKPSNIFLRGDVARVGDYGLAKLIGDGRQTLSFGRGTPHYMAPEMLKNRGDHRADIYSLGVILYEIQCGQLPFPCSDGIGNLLRDDDEPPVFSASFPVALRPVVERALRLDPDHRYWSLNEFLADMGQTARQGDSVHMGVLSMERGPDGELMDSAAEAGIVGDPWSGAGNGPSGARSKGDGVDGDQAQADGAKAGEVPSTKTGPTGTGEDLRRSAAELARGAVGLARGVWDGVVGAEDQDAGQASDDADREGGQASTRVGPSQAELAKRSSKAPNPAAAEDPPTPPFSDVVSIEGLDEPESEMAKVEQSPVLKALVSERSRRRSQGMWPPLREGEAQEDASSSRAGPWKALPKATGPAAGRTVPVPPRTDGGIIGAVGATMILGVEVMLALVSGPVFYSLRSIGQGIDNSMSFVPGVFGTILKMGMFFFLLFLLGAGLVGISIYLKF